MLLAHIDQWILEEILIALRADYNAAAGSGAKGSIQQQAVAQVVPDVESQTNLHMQRAACDRACR